MSPSRRGLAAAMYSVLHSIGFFLVLILGTYLPWRWAVSVPAFLAVPVFVCIACLHESPEWLNKMGHNQKCGEALTFYMKDLEGLQNKKDKKPTKKSQEHRRNLLVSKARVKSFLHSIILRDPSFLRNFLSFYAVEIFKLSGSPLPALDTSWIVSITKIGCSVSSFYVLHKYDQ